MGESKHKQRPPCKVKVKSPVGLLPCPNISHWNGYCWTHDPRPLKGKKA